MIFVTWVPSLHGSRVFPTVLAFNNLTPQHCATQEFSRATPLPAPYTITALQHPSFTASQLSPALSVSEHSASVNRDQFHSLGSVPSARACEAFSGTARTKFEDLILGVCINLAIPTC